MSGGIVPAVIVALGFWFGWYLIKSGENKTIISGPLNNYMEATKNWPIGLNLGLIIAVFQKLLRVGASSFGYEISFFWESFYLIALPVTVSLLWHSQLKVVRQD